MELHAVLPNESTEMPAQEVVALGVLAERLGYHTVWLPDHLLPPGEYGTTYGGVYEPLITLSHLAARTTTVRLGTSVLVLPMRNPFVVAKQVATLDALSGGRVTLGVGIGWDRQEFVNVGADFATRGPRTDEAIQLIRRLFRTGGGPFPGRYYGFETGVFAPKPAQHDLPIMVGGISDAALRRAARHADIWQSFAVGPAEFAERVAYLRQHTDRPLVVGARTSYGDSLEEFVTRARAYATAGADHLAVWFGGAVPSAHDTIAERMVAFADAMAGDPPV